MTCSRSRWDIRKAFLLALRYIIFEMEETKDAQKKYQVTGSMVWNVWNKQTTNVVSIATYHRWTMEVRVVPCLARPKNAKTVQPWGYLWWWDYLLQLWFQSGLCLSQSLCLVTKTKTKQRGEVFLTLNLEKRDITRIRVSYSQGIPRPRLCMFGTLSGTMGLKWFSAPHREKLWRDRWLTLLWSRPSSFISSPPFLAWQHQNHHH